MKGGKCHALIKPGGTGGLSKAAQNSKGLFLKRILLYDGCLPLLLNCFPLFGEMDELPTHFSRLLFLKQ